MDQWVALLRGVNVGGGNKVPMADLRALALSMGWTGVKSYIASGNLVFHTQGELDALAANLRQVMIGAMAVDVPVIVLSAAAIRAAAAACPFAPDVGKHVHVFFLFGDPVLNHSALDQWRAPSEELIVTGRLGWLHAPEGIGRSKLAERLHRVITGTDMTARNLNTLRALAEMLD